MPTPRLIILGSSSGKASAHRAGSSYLLDLGSHGVLIDCGDGATRNFLQAGYAPEWVDHILISHTHADHAAGLPYFMQQRYLPGTKNPLTIHCPGEAAGPLNAIFNFGYLFKDRLPFPIEYKPLIERWPLDLDGAQVTAYPTTHLAGLRAHAERLGLPNRGECFAMRVQVGDRVILYSADLGSLNDLDAIPTPIDWLLVETTHVPLERLWPWAESRRIRRIVLTHLADDFDFDVVAHARPTTAAEILIAEDGTALDVND